MNELILKLVTEARQYAWDSETHWSAGPERERLFEEKFAELIVKECMSVCIDDIADPRDTTELKCAKKIKHHFGVE